MIIIILIILAIIAILYLTRIKEHYNMGALIQLTAKDPQDSYLTGDAWKHYPRPALWYANYPDTYYPYYNL